jgi:hypothetical protein
MRHRPLHRDQLHTDAAQQPGARRYQRPATLPEEDQDTRFVANFAVLQSIATSHGQNDSGMFELNFRDERYLPFEGTGAVSSWRIELPKDCNAFDFDTIPDVILHLRYTSRTGGELLKTAARSAVADLIEDATEFPPPRLFSAKHEFPDAWYRFLHPGDSETMHVLDLDLARERFPFRFRSSKMELVLHSMTIFLKLKEGINKAGNDLRFALAPDLFPDPNEDGKHVLKPHGDFHALSTQDFKQGQVQDPPSTWTVTVAEGDIQNVAELGREVKINGQTRWRLNPDAVEDLWVHVKYSAEAKGI